MKKVILKFYSKTNLGDDLLVKILLDRYINKFMIIDSGNSKFYINHSNALLYRNNLIKYYFKLVGKFLKRVNYSYTVFSRKYDLLIYIGGSLFIENDNINLWKREKIFFQNLRIPYYIIGSNVGPFKSSEFVRLLYEIFSKAADVCFRDSKSYNIFKELNNVRISTDIGFALKTENYGLSSKCKYAVVSVIDCQNRFDEKICSEYEKAVVKIVDNLIVNGYIVKLMSFCKSEGDEIAISRIVKKIGNADKDSLKIYHYDGDVDKAVNIISGSEIVIGTRFHAIILGLLFNKKVLPIIYSDKTSNILNDFGYKGSTIDIRKIQQSDYDNIDFNNIDIFDISVQKALAEKQFLELDKVLVRRRNESK